MLALLNWAGQIKAKSPGIDSIRLSNECEHGVVPFYELFFARFGMTRSDVRMSWQLSRETKTTEEPLKGELFEVGDRLLYQIAKYYSRTNPM